MTGTVQLRAVPATGKKKRRTLRRILLWLLALLVLAGAGLYAWLRLRAEYIDQQLLKIEDGASHPVE